MKQLESGGLLSVRDVSGEIPKKRFLITYLLTLFGISAWITVIGAAPYYISRGSILGPFFYSLFAPVCHQIPSRSFYLFGHPLAVCGRCLGIYAGFFLGSICYPLIGDFLSARLPRRALLIAMSIPIVLDTVGNMLRVWSSPNVIRFLMGLSWGAVLPFYFIPAVASIKWRKGGRT